MKPKTKQIITTVKKGAWFIQGFNGYPLYLHGVASTTGWMAKGMVGVNYSHFFLRMHESRAHWYYDELDMAKVGEGYFKKIKTVAQLRSYEEKHKNEYFKARAKTGEIVPGKLPDLSFPQLVALGEKLVRELTLSVNFAHVQEGISFVSEMRLKKILDSRGLNTHENHQLLSSPVAPSFLSEAQTLLGKIRDANSTRKNALVQKFLSEFGWLDNSYVQGKTLQVADVLRKARLQKHVPSLKELSKTKQRKIKLIKTLGLSPEELFVVHTIEICTKWQDNRKKYIMQTIGRFEPVIDALAKRLSLLPAAFKYLTPYEFTLENLSSKKFLRELGERYPRCAYYTNKDGIFSFPGKEYGQIEKAVGGDGSSKISELKGNIANKGIAKGRARICKTIHDIAKVKKGEILIAYMTRPEFLPAMQKAAAFVTNEGGITSHAAIISREMNKPCIIGTKIATEVFHDGDMLVVDANNGTVKKI